MHNDDRTAGFHPPEINEQLSELNEKLAVVKHCIETTPPLNFNRRNRLLEQQKNLFEMRAQMMQMIGPSHGEPNDNSGTSTPSSLSSAQFAQLAPHQPMLGRLKNEGSVLGFSTPQTVTEDPFASMVEEPFVETNRVADKTAQESAYTPTQLSVVDSLG